VYLTSTNDGVDSASSRSKCKDFVPPRDSDESTSTCLQRIYENIRRLASKNSHSIIFFRLRRCARSDSVLPATHSTWHDGMVSTKFSSHSEFSVFALDKRLLYDSISCFPFRRSECHQLAWPGTRHFVFLASFY